MLTDSFFKLLAINEIDPDENFRQNNVFCLCK